MYRDWPNVETGVRLATMSELIEGIPRRLFIGPYPIETRYRGQCLYVADVANMDIVLLRVRMM
jgi:hypothetical protein